jgi:hypothetical protein
MATRLPTYDFTVRKPRKTRSTKSYPWGLWLDGSIWQITRGEDFEPEPLMMERVLRTRAAVLHQALKLRHEEGDVIVFQATPGIPADPKWVKGPDPEPAKNEQFAIVDAEHPKRSKRPVRKVTK